MMFVIDLNIAYEKLIVSSQDFVKLSEILSRSQRVDDVYFDNGKALLLKARRQVQAYELTDSVMTDLEVAEQRAADKAARELKELTEGERV